MNKVIKAEWIKRIKNSPKSRPYHILNKMYEEAARKPLRVENKYRLRDGARTAPKMIGLTEYDMIHPDVKDWAELDTPSPLLSSYHEYGGVGMTRGVNTVGVIWEHGSFMKDGRAVKSVDALEIFTEIINKDL